MTIEEPRPTVRKRNCPFCGGEADYEIENSIWGDEYIVTAYCKNCPARMTDVYPRTEYSASDAIKKTMERWNRRSR